MILCLRRGLALAAAAALLTGCGSSSTMRIFVLGSAPPSVPGVSSEAGLPVVELTTVSVPDYLDSSDILRKSGPNEMIASPSGRWGERLSLGLTHALASALSAQLPGTVITMAATDRAQRIVVEIDDFDIAADGRCLVAARWGMLGADGKPLAASEHETFTGNAASIDDPAVAAAMTGIVDRLAEQIAVTVRQGLTHGPARLDSRGSNAPPP